MITKEPKGAGDSIGKQLRTKTRVLSDQFGVPIDYAWSGTADHDNIWKRLYACRSAIAHGSGFTFEGENLILRDLKTVDQAMHKLVRQVLKYALREPQQMLDLKYL